jgi:superfamily II DNA or RNA helicase
MLCWKRWISCCGVCKKLGGSKCGFFFHQTEQAEQSTVPTTAPSLLLTPHGQLSWTTEAAGKLAKGRLSDSGALLLELAQSAACAGEDEAVQFWRSYAQEFISAVCRLPGLHEGAWRAGPTLPADDALLAKTLHAPSSRGMEYLNTRTLQALWQEMQAAWVIQATHYQEDIHALLGERYPAWHSVGRVTLHLAENPRDELRPFAFLATYAHKLNDRGVVEHLPLARALKDYATDAAALRSLLEPLSEAAVKSSVVSQLLESKRVFNAVAWAPEQAFAFLQEVPTMEEAGLVIKVPDWWQNRRPPAPQVQVVLDAGEKQSRLGIDSLLKFRISVAVAGEALSEAEIEKLLRSTAPLLSLKGKWIEPDGKKLKEALDFWHRAQQAHEQGIPFYQGLRWLAGWQARSEASTVMETSSVQAGPQLQAQLQQLRADALKPEPPPTGLRAKLRPYQQVGLEWLSYMTSVGLGACLADDMGLGKTVQLIALLVRLYEDGCRGPSLIVTPASLLGNWQRELTQFAPELECHVAHRSCMNDAEMQSVADGTHTGLKRPCVFITTYAQTGRLRGLQQMRWEILTLDEAQTIKNAGSQQAQHIRQLQAKAKVALSGTPIENRLTDLWSLFEFLNPGLLGSATDFALKARGLSAQGGYAALRQIVRPFILRRLKTDPKIAPELPRKTELTTFCGLSKRQAVLYQRAVNEMQQALKHKGLNADATDEEAVKAAEAARRAVILGMLLKLKQICNHPSLFSGDQVYAAEDSGKFVRLHELITNIADRQERVLIFTQFREMTEVLAQYLTPLFGRAGLVLHGGTAVAKRSKLVEQFQQPDGPPFFVISVKAGGTGLTLTAASHVIHFDRWWNPAVEDQATDRAYRIGQTQPVLVHKMVARGTLEERIDRLLKDKKDLQQELLGSGKEEGALPLLTQMNDTELIQFLSLAEEWQD